MLFANKDAKERLKRYGRVRELVELYELAEQKKVFNRKDSLNFIDDLLKVGYRRSYLRALRKLLL